MKGQRVGKSGLSAGATGDQMNCALRRLTVDRSRKENADEMRTSDAAKKEVRKNR